MGTRISSSSVRKYPSATRAEFSNRDLGKQKMLKYVLKIYTVALFPHDLGWTVYL